MSEELRFTKEGPSRALRLEERKIIEALLSARYELEEIEKILTSKVYDMADGGMGIRFHALDQNDRRLGTTIGEAEYVDEDGTLVSIVFNVDQTGKPFELDLWKVDFSPLLRYPEPSALRMTRRAT